MVGIVAVVLLLTGLGAAQSTTDGASPAAPAAGEIASRSVTGCAEPSPGAESLPEVVERPDASENAEAEPGPDEDLKRLRLALSDEDAGTRIRALVELADHGGDEATAALAASALSDVDASVREEAILGLGETGDESRLDILEQALMDTNDGVREAAIEALSDIGGDDAAWTLAIALTDQASFLREEAVYALGGIGGEIAVGLLQQALADEEESVREAAADVLAELSEEGE